MSIAENAKAAAEAAFRRFSSVSLLSRLLLCRFCPGGLLLRRLLCRLLRSCRSGGRRGARVDLLRILVPISRSPSFFGKANLLTGKDTRLITRPCGQFFDEIRRFNAHELVGS